MIYVSPVVFNLFYSEETNGLVFVNSQLSTDKQTV